MKRGRGGGAQEVGRFAGCRVFSRLQDLIINFVKNIFTSVQALQIVVAAWLRLLCYLNLSSLEYLIILTLYGAFQG